MTLCCWLKDVAESFMDEEGLIHIKCGMPVKSTMPLGPNLLTFEVETCLCSSHFNIMQHVNVCCVNGAVSL